MELTVWHPADGVLVVKWGLQCRPRKMTEGGLSCAEPRDDVSTYGSVPGPGQGLSKCHDRCGCCICCYFVMVQ